MRRQHTTGSPEHSREDCKMADLPDGSAALNSYRHGLDEARPRGWRSYADTLERGQLADERGPFRWKRGKSKPSSPMLGSVARILGEIP